MKNFLEWVSCSDANHANGLYEHDGEYMTAAQKKKAEEEDHKSTPEWYKGQMVDGKWKETTRADVERQRKDYDKSH